MSKINLICFALSQDDLEVMLMRQCRKCRQFNTIWHYVCGDVLYHFAISQFQSNLTISSKFHNCDPISTKFNTIQYNAENTGNADNADNTDNANNPDNTENTIQYGIRDACSTADIRDYHKAWSMYVHTQGVWIFNYLSHRIVIYQICK